MLTQQTIVVINGSIASGKSTVARGLAAHLRLLQVRTAVIDIDLVYEMLADDPKNNEQTWNLAYCCAGALANELLSYQMRVVIVDGAFWENATRKTLLKSIDRTIVQSIFVTLDVSFEEALRRAQGDKTRGLSQQPEFLRPHFCEFKESLAKLSASDSIFDTEKLNPEELVVRISALIQS